MSSHTGRSTSFHGSTAGAATFKIRRPESQPEIRIGGNNGGREGGQKLTKLLLNVTVQRSPGPVQVVVSPERTVADLVRFAVDAYVREGRRPLLSSSDPKAYELHYSQYSLESLDPEEKLINLGSRNFFLCQKAARMTPLPSM